MPVVTRSASGAATKKVTSQTAAPTQAAVPAPRRNKRKTTEESAPTAIEKATRKRPKTSKQEVEKVSRPGENLPAPLSEPVRTVSRPVSNGEDAQALVPAVLTFSFEEAKQHLIGVDRRFEHVFSRLPCKPFETLERVDPFRTLTNSIMGQQISWLAARSITHRFIRLFDPSLPEKPTEHLNSPNSFYPSAKHVANMDVATLRTAGLSGRKAEYVLDLATRFADGRLSTEKLLEANDDDLYKMLTEVRGIGRWTVDMFAMFSLRRPDILPVGDLGVQRGVLRWFLSLHSPTYNIMISPEKLPKNPSDEPAPTPPQKNSVKQTDDGETLPVLGETATQEARELTPDFSSIPPAPEIPATPSKRKGKGKDRVTELAGGEATLSILPEPFTPSINETLNMSIGTNDLHAPPPPLPEGLAIADMKSRLDGKKKIKGALLTPKEIEDLTDSWRPYRSLGVYYMWALAELPK